MLKIILLIVLCLLIVFIAYKIMSYYRQRQKFFENVCEFCSYMQNEIGFLKTDVKSLISQYKSNCSGDFLKVIDMYIKVLNKTDDFYANYLQELSKINILTKREREKLCVFFSNLGKSGQQEELLQIQNFKNEISSILKTTTEENNKYGNLSIKLGVLLSVAVFIIFI